MKYIKYYLVNAETGLAVPPYISNKAGKTHPNISGLDVYFRYPDSNGHDKFYATCPDESIITDGTGVELMTEQVWLTDAELAFNHQKNILNKQVYDFAKELRDNSWYDSNEISFALAVKIPEAESAEAAETDNDADVAAPYLASEATYRNITTKELAQLVLENFNNQKLIEAKIAGIRGLKIDLINTVSFDSENIKESFNSLHSLDLFLGWE